jgi:hypothetical protein
MTDDEKRAIAEAVRRHDQRVAQAAVDAAAKSIAEDTVRALRKAGWLIDSPQERVVVREVVRDEKGQITSIVERKAVDSTPLPAAKPAMGFGAPSPKR